MGPVDLLEPGRPGVSQPGPDPPGRPDRLVRLARMLSPRCAAVVGASRKPGSIGWQIVRALRRSQFAGALYPVNPAGGEVDGVPVVPSLEAIEEPIDLAVVAVPATAVIEAVRQCAAAGVAGVVIISAGFREVGGEGAVREAELAAVLHETGLRAVGPNCMGIFTNDPANRVNATFVPMDLPHGNVAIASQSGALGLALLERARSLGLGVSRFVSLGNRVDVSSNDLLELWENDPDVGVILLYLEHFGNPRRFVEVARRVSRSKPILAVKSGRSVAGARAAASHTGSLAQGAEWTEALFEQCGVVRAATIPELFHLARVFALAPPPRGRRVGIVTNSGGPGVMAADAMADVGLEMAELAPSSVAALQACAPAAASLTNPIDLTAGGGAAAYRGALEAVLADDGVDSVLVVYTPPTTQDDDAVVDAILQARRRGKPVLACVLGPGGPPFDRLPAAGLPTFTFPEAAVRALGAYADHTERRARPSGSIPSLPDIQAPAARQAIAAALQAGQEWLDADQARAVLAAYGIAQPGQRICHTPEETASFAAGLGRVVLKAQGPDLLHKTELGAVVLDVPGAGAAQAHIDLVSRLTQAGHQVDAVLVQEQIQARRELLLGIASNPRDGASIAFGLGGIHAEVLRDIAFRLAPLTDADAARLVRSIRAWPLLQGHRGQPGADVPALEDLVLRLSALAIDLPEVRELDLNPVLVGGPGEGAVAVDARIRISPLENLHAPSPSTGTTVLYRTHVATNSP